jgi:hypothetical protein
MRWCLLLFCGACLAADAQQQVFDIFTKIATALSADNPLVFFDAVDHEMPHYQDFEANLTALAAQAELTNSIEVLSEQGDDDHRIEQLDWFMQIVGKADTVAVERRRQVLTFRLERRGKKKKWKIVSIDPLEFFRPPK